MRKVGLLKENKAKEIQSKRCTTKKDRSKGNSSKHCTV